jgi:hypothetical protein
MKKLFLFLFLVVSSNTLFAQDEYYSGPLELQWGTYLDKNHSGYYYNGVDFFDEDLYNNSKGELIVFTCNDIDTIIYSYDYEYLIWKFDSYGNLIWRNSIDDKYHHNTVQMCIDSSDNIYFVNNKVLLKYADNGDLVYSINAKELSIRTNNELSYNEEYNVFGPSNIIDLQTDIDGNIYMYSQNNSILKFDTDGNFLWSQKYSKINNFCVSKDNIPVLLNRDSQSLLFLDKETGITFKQLRFKNISVVDSILNDDEVENINFGYFNINYNNDIVLFGSIVYKNGSHIHCILKFDTEGNNSWITLMYNNYANTSVLKIDKNNNIYFTENDHLLTNFGRNIRIRKYSNNGKFLWYYVYGSYDEECAYSLSINNENKIFLYGITRSKTGIAFGNAYKKEFYQSCYYCPYNNFITCLSIDSISAIALDTVLNKPIDTLDIKYACIDKDTYADIVVKSQSDFMISLNEDKLLDSEYFSAEYIGEAAIEPGDTIGLRVHFMPSDTGYYETMLYIYCDERGSPLDSVLVRAWAYKTEFEALGITDFEFSRIGENKYSDIYVRNTGTTGAYIENIDELNAPFKIKSIIPKLPAFLKPGEQIKLRVEFNPDALGYYEDYIAVSTGISDSTCPAEIRIKINGECIDKYLKIDSLDFGFIPYCKTKTDTIHVINRFENAITLKYSELLGDNADNFSIVSEPSPNYQLDYKDTALYIIEFYPQAPYKDKQAFLKVHTNMPDEEELTATLDGVSEDLNISLSDIDFGDKGINRDHQLQATIYNQNSFSVNVSQIKSQESWVKDISPNHGTINANDNLNILVTVNIPEPIQYSGEIVITTSEPCEEVFTGQVIVNGIESQADITSELDFGKLEYCQEKAMIMDITNTGELSISIIRQEISGKDKDLFLFSDTFFETELEPNELYTREIIFKPENSTNGTKTAQCITTILMDNKEKEFTTNLSGTKYTIEHNIPDEISLTSSGIEPNSEEIFIKNAGKNSFIITDIQLEDGDIFDYQTNIVGNPLLPNEEVKLTINFIETEYGDYSDKMTISIESDNCEYEYEVSLTGLVRYLATISLPDTTAVIGTKDYRIPLTAKLSRDDVTLEVESYEAEIEYFVGAYNPEGIANAIFIDNEIQHTKRYIKIQGNNTTITGETILAELTGTVLLSEELVVPLYLKSFTWSSNIPIETIDGKLTLTGACVPEISLVQPIDGFSVVVVPNPAEDEANISIISPVENTPVYKIFTVEGVQIDTGKIATQKQNNSFTGTATIELTNYHSGIYLLTVQIQNNILVEKVVVVK